MKRLLLVLSLILFIPSAAQANIWIPSFVQSITSPLITSLTLVALTVTIPLTLAVSFIEALVFRRFIKGIPLSKVMGNLITINAITSLFGSVTMPRGTELWPGLPLCYGLTVLTESVLLLLFAGQMYMPRSYRQSLLISARINTVSYTFLTALLLAVIYIPAVGNESPVIAQSANGKLAVITFSDEVRVIDISSNHIKLSDATSWNFDPHVNQFQAGTDGQIVGLLPQQVVELNFSKNNWNKTFVDLPPDLSNPIGFSQDRKLLFCTFKNQQVVYDLKSRRVLRSIQGALGTIEQASFSHSNLFLTVTTPGRESRLIDLKNGSSLPIQNTCSLTFSPVNDQLAWKTGDDTIWTSDSGVFIFDYLKKKKTLLKVPGSIVSNLAWSPDGHFIAYIGHSNPFTAQNWEPNVRVLNVETGLSATIYRNIWTAGAPCTLLWFR